VVGPQVVARCAILGEAALQAQIVSVPSMGKDHHGTTQARHVQQRPRLSQQRGVLATRLRRRGVGAGSGEEVVEQLVLAGHRRYVEPRQRLAGQVRDVGQRHEPAGQDQAAGASLLKQDADAVALLEQVAQQGVATRGLLADPQPPQPVNKQASGDGTQHRAAESGSDHRLGAVVALTGEHERQSRQEAITGHVEVIVDGECVQVVAERLCSHAQLARLRCGRPTVRTHLITIAHPARPPILLATADASRLLPAIITRSLPEPNREIRPDLAYQLVAPRGGGLFAACVRCEVTRDDGGYANTLISA